MVNLGDWHDSAFASRWENEEDWDSETEFKATAEDAQQLNDAAPRAKFIYLEGNHEDNMRQPGRIPKPLRASIAERRNTLIDPHTQHWKIIPYAHDSFYRLGQITFQHGCQTNVNAERDQAILYGTPFGLHVSAHTHRPKPPTLIELPGKVPCFGAHYCNVGTGADWEQMRYIQRSNHAMWGRGLMVIEAKVKRMDWFKKKMWNAELLIHSMASERAVR